MKIKIKIGYCLRRGVDVRPGQVVEATEKEAFKALALGRAVLAMEDEQAEAVAHVSAQPPALAAQSKPRKWGRK